MVETWNYEIKKKSRKVILDFARKHMPRYDPEDIRMLCLAGIDCADIYEISRLLRIPDSQVTIVERDPDVFTEIDRKKTKGEIDCDLFYGEIGDYLERTPDTFRFISLDYTGQLTLERMKDIHTIFERQLLDPHSILHTNFYGKMETRYVHAAYTTILLGRGIKSGTSWEEMIDIAYETPMAKLRDEVITECLIVLGLRSPADIPETLLQNKGMADLWKKINDRIDSVDKHDPRYKWGMERYKRIAFIDNLTKHIRKNLLDSFLVDAAVSNALARPYYPIYFERYRYKGPKGALMYTDLIEFDQRRKIYESNPINLSWDPERIHVYGDVPVQSPIGGWQFKNPTNLLNFQNIKKLQEFGWRFFDKDWTPKFKERQLLN
jgi:hypothetical protein